METITLHYNTFGMKWIEIMIKENMIIRLVIITQFTRINIFKFEQMDKWSSGTRTSHQRMIFKAAATMPKTYAGRKSGPNQNNPTDRRR